MKQAKLSVLKPRGEIIRQLREKKSVSRSEMYEYLGVSRGCYAKIENGLRDLRCDELMKICEYLNVNPSLILGYKPKALPTDKVHKLAIQNGFEQARQRNGQIDISPRLYAFANQVIQVSF